MAGAAVNLPVDLADIQGLLRFGYRHHVESCFLLLRVVDPAAARAWLAQVAVADALARDPPPATALQIAFSSDGLRALGVDAALVGRFAKEFVAGSVDDGARARRLGDVGANAPMHWQWGHGEHVPHLLVLLYALPGRLAGLRQRIEAETGAAFGCIGALTSTHMHGFEPFGFRDGLSQPEPDWQRRIAAVDQQQPRYRNLTSLGEFVLGYPNEYGACADRPLLDPGLDRRAGQLPRAEDAPELADLGRNGSYLVLRQLQQDVCGFWQFVDARAGHDEQLRERIAAAMVGRTRGGAPLVNDGARAGDPAASEFDYRGDPRGIRCPLGAHIRRANPRTGDLPPGPPGVVSWLRRSLGFDPVALEHDLIASTRFHRLLRRGREYGTLLTMEQALAGPAGEVESGIHFICLGADIARQFEFVQGAWIAATHFDRLHGESDPLLGARPVEGTRDDADRFSMPQAAGPDLRLQGLPQFVRVRGSGYFFMPGLRALRYLAGVDPVERMPP